MYVRKYESKYVLCMYVGMLDMVMVMVMYVKEKSCVERQCHSYIPSLLFLRSMTPMLLVHFRLL